MQKHNKHLVGELLRPIKIEKNLCAKHKVLLGAQKWENKSSSAVQRDEQFLQAPPTLGNEKKSTKKQSSREVFPPHLISWRVERKEAAHIACQLALLGA